MLGSRIARLRKHATNATWASLEYLFYPLLMLVATPVYLRSLGVVHYGLLVLVTTIVSLSAVGGLGMASATVRFVAAHRGAHNPPQVVLIVRQTLTLAILGGIAFGGVIAIAAPFLAAKMSAEMGNQAQVTLALTLGAGTLLLNQAEAVFGATLKGFERFGLSAGLDIVFKILSVGVGVVAAILSRSVTLVLVCFLAVTILSTAIRAVIASRIAGGPVYLPVWQGDTAKEVWSFGAWAWLQGVASAVFSNLDRFVISAALGAAPLAYYGVCVQVASQVHAIPAAAMSILIPLVSRQIGAGAHENVKRIERLSVAANLAISFTLVVSFLAIGDWFLRLWLGEVIATEVQPLFTWMVLAYGLVSLSIAPYFLLLGRGDARFVSLVGSFGSAISAATAAALIPALGLMGGVLARAAYGPVLLLYYVRLIRRRRD